MGKATCFYNGLPVPILIYAKYYRWDSQYLGHATLAVEHWLEQESTHYARSMHSTTVNRLNNSLSFNNSC